MSFSDGSDHNTNLNIRSLILPVIFVISVIFALRQRLTPRAKFPVVGRDENVRIFGRWRARAWCWWNFEEALWLAWKKYGRENKPCILSTLDNEVILLPPSSATWLASQREILLSTIDAQMETMQTRYTLFRYHIMNVPYSFDTTKSELEDLASTLTPEICDELSEAVCDYWGVEPEPAEEGEEPQEWKTIALHESIAKVVARVTNRVLVGLPFCRDEAYIGNVVSYTGGVALSASILRFLPSYARPFLAWLAAWSVRGNAKAIDQLLKPEVLRTQHARPIGHRSSKQVSNGTSKSVAALHETLLQRLPQKISGITGVLGHTSHAQVVSVPTMSFIATNALLDILATPKDEKVISTLTEEASDAMSTDEDLWTQANLGKMKQISSALRESSRRANMTGMTEPRKVMNESGLTTPEGWHLPYGSLVAVHTYASHKDENLYLDADQYKPWRYLNTKPRAAIDEFPFSHPFPDALGEQILKLLLAYLLTRYDVYMIMEGGVGGNWNGKGKRAECEWMVGGRCLPPTGAKVKVRRKKAYR